MYCGVVAENSKVIYGIGSVDGSELGFFYEDIKLNSVNVNNLDMKIYHYNIFSRKLAGSYEATIDCNKDTLSYGTPQVLYDVNASSGRIYKYLVSTTCKYAIAELKKITPPISNISAPSVQRKNKANREKENLGNINSAKIKCSELGFIKGSDRFNKCVLELFQ